MAIRKRFIVSAAAAILAAVAVQAWPHGYKAAPPGYLIAHAGGGLPFSRYTNSREAFDASYRRGLRLFESDLQVRHGGDVVLGHDLLPRWPAPMSFAELLGWLRAHPDAVLVTDFKGANIAGLAAIPADLRGQVIPQIYRPAELAPVRALGYRRIIYTAYAARLPSDRLLAFVNHADLWAVTIPAARANLAPRIHHPVFVHTINDPKEAAKLRKAGVSALYTDYLTPYRNSAQNHVSLSVVNATPVAEVLMNATSSCAMLARWAERSRAATKNDRLPRYRRLTV